MKVCFVVGTLARGGAEKQLVFMLRALQGLGASREVLCLTQGEAYDDEIRSTGTTVTHVGESQNRLLRAWRIIRAVRDTRADVIQSSHFYTNIYAGMAGRFLGVPSIGSVRSDLAYELEAHRFTGGLQISLPDMLITNSGIARRRLIERRIDPARIEFVRNVVEVERDAPEVHLPRDLTILFAGRLDDNKRPDRFVRLASILTRQYPHRRLQFRIAGEGTKRKELESTARRLGLGPERLLFLGACGRMSDVYRGADILVTTSEREGTPNVVLEAMAYGLPVVASNVGGTSEIVAPTRGILVDPNDENGLVDATARLINDSNLRRQLGSEGRRWVGENHSFDRLQSHLQRIYQKLRSRIDHRAEPRIA